jgi:photosystem II stability/assembly factor-like uncharacterized protein
MNFVQNATKFLILVVIISLVSLTKTPDVLAKQNPYEARGIGGGGAMSGLSFSPYTHLWFVGTDMGTLFRSTDDGKSWHAISHKQVVFDSNLALSSSVGFSADPKVVFYSQAGKKPKRSLDAGVTWSPIPVPLKKDETIRYWVGDSSDPSFILCATNQGLFKSTNKGISWRRVPGIEGPSAGTFIQADPKGEKERRIFHATTFAVYLSNDHGETFESWYSPVNTGIRSFAGGANRSSITLSFIDTNGTEACSWARHARSATDEQKEATLEECGFVWTSTIKPSDITPHFVRSDQEGGRFIRMAENDPKTIYVTAGNWVRQYGTKVWVSKDAGKNWSLRFHIYNWDTHPYSPWPKELLEYSAVGLDVGWDDGAYPSFEVNRRNSAQAGGTGYYFLHVTFDYGEKWKAPFTSFADTGERAPKKKWKSTGLEMTSVQRLKFHPKAPKVGYASVADMGGFVTEDGGISWRISKCKYNTNYDYAFDPNEMNSVFAASGSLHDYPLGNNALVDGTEGGIFRSKDRGRTWTRLTPETKDWNTEFLSVAYDPIHKVLYGGTRGKGIGHSTNGGKSWEYINDGLPSGGKIIPQIEIDPKNGNVYALLAGDAPAYTNQSATGIYLLSVSTGGKQWRLLRQTVHFPHGVAAGTKLWWYPTAFAVDFTKSERNVLWLTDYESKGAWLASGIWKSEDSGANWKRVHQFTHPSAITIDPKNPNHVYASGLFTIDNSWGEGGAIYSMDGGLTWKKNEVIPLLSNLDGTVIDPNSPGHLFYLFFGGGILYGPKPQ